jgi:DNA-binding transcriptional LysR family regulator
MLDWDDLRYFLAVVRSGSTKAAARALGVNQTTAARRITLLEEKVGTSLFERTPTGYRLAEDGAPLVAAAEAAEAEVARFADLAAMRGRGPSTLRVTTNEPLANVILAPAVRAFRVLYPDVRIEILVSPRQLDLAHGEADIALRAAPRPTDPCLVARRVGDAHWGVYASRDYLSTHGMPRDVASLAGHTILVIPDASGSRLASLVAAPAAVEERETINDLCVAVRAGLGVASLPCVFGDGFPDLVRCFVQEDPVTPVWLVYHERLRGAPQVRAFLDFTIARTQAARAQLLGRISPEAEGAAPSDEVEDFA